METIHRILGDAAVVAVAVGIAWSLVAASRPEWGGSRLARFQALVVILFIFAAGAGLGQLVSAGQPKESLHFLYAAVAIAVLPLARSFVPASDVPAAERRVQIVTLAAFVVLGFVLYRLFATG
jgi:hypothetical protein